jgi:Tripartite tricarboxylate transporter TctB family
VSARGIMALRQTQDFWAGIAFLAAGAAFALAARGHDTEDFGPGFFPFWLGVILAGLGVLIVLRALRIDCPSIERPHWRSGLLVLSSVLLFGVLLRHLGLLLTAITVVCVASLAERGFKVREMALLAVGLSVFSCCVFVLGLKLPMPLCPDGALFNALAFCSR